MSSNGCVNESSTGVALKKGPWTATEDAILIEYVKKHGEGNWNAVQKNSGLLRCGKSCRLRWANHLRPNLKKGMFSPDEERLILELHAKLGNKWARMAAQLPGRTDNEIKNYWNTRIKRHQRAGLPLYPLDIQRKTALQHRHCQSPQLPPPSLQYKSNYSSSLPLFNPTSFSTIAPAPISNSQSHFLSTPIHPVKQYSNDDFALSFPFSTPYIHQNLHSHQFNSGNFNFSPISVKSELPSGQFPGSATSAVHSGSTDSKFAFSLGQSDSGLFDAFLEERQTIVGSGNLQREGMFSETSIEKPKPPLQSASQLGDLRSSHLSIGTKTKEELTDMIDSADEDLSTLLDLIPSVMPIVPQWHSDSGEASNRQPGITDSDIGLEIKQFVTSLSATEHDWSLESCSWNNLPEIC